MTGSGKCDGVDSQGGYKLFNDSIQTSVPGSYTFKAQATDPKTGLTVNATSNYEVVDSGDPGGTGDPGSGPGDVFVGLMQGELPHTGGGWAILLLSGGVLIVGGGFLVRRFSR